MGPAPHHSADTRTTRSTSGVTIYQQALREHPYGGDRCPQAGIGRWLSGPVRPTQPPTIRDDTRQMFKTRIFQESSDTSEKLIDYGPSPPTDERPSDLVA